MKWLISFVFFFLFSTASADTLFQEFSIGGQPFYAKINEDSLQYLYERNQAPEFIWKDFSGIFSLVRVSSLLWKPTEAEELSLREQIDYFISAMSNKYGVKESTLHRIIKCESNYSVFAVGDKGKAYGIAQFWLNTFNLFEKEAGLQFEYKNWRNQIELLAWGLSHGKKNHWTCR